jgi:hypothetical protein
MVFLAERIVVVVSWAGVGRAVMLLEVARGLMMWRGDSSGRELAEQSGRLPAASATGAHRHARCRCMHESEGCDAQIEMGRENENNHDSPVRITLGGGCLLLSSDNGPQILLLTLLAVVLRRRGAGDFLRLVYRGLLESI